VASVPLISLLFTAAALLPTFVHASILSDIIAMFTQSAQAEVASPATFRNVQTMPLLRPAMNISPAPARGGGDVTIVDNSALVASEGPSGTLADIEKPKNATISRYVVREGDTLSGIAQMFEVTTNTIRWANDISANGTLKVGQVLTILPIPGVKYTVKKGDTLASLAKQFKADPDEIANYNEIANGTLAVGTEIIIPDGEIAAPPAPAKPKAGVNPAHDVGPIGTLAQIGYYVAPLSVYTRTQNIHGYNGVDLAAPNGTPIFAAASGQVVVAKAGGYNGGYGSYVVIQHDNGSQTLYAHMSKVAAYDGQTVIQGQVIGYVGSTGKSTGNHVHFEIRNGIKNPF
jgi:murein DD-endopeptidase MepM/ murein hydrolase activator NlpD